MQHITDAQVADLLDYRGVIAILAEAFGDLAHARAGVHARQRTDCAGVRLSTMGAIWPARRLAGVKVYPTVAGQFGFALLLFDLDTNAPLALLDGRELTRFRTAGITAMVAARAAPRGARTLALIGAGAQGRAQAEALATQFDLAEIRVADPRADVAWCERLRHASGARVRIVDAEEAVRGADLVVTATASASPVLRGEWLSGQAFVAAIGTSSPKGRELDDATMDRAARILVEWAPQSLVEAGELVLWSGRSNAADRIVDLPALFRGDPPWQAPGITVFKSVGVGLSDIATARLVLERLA